MRLEHRIFQNFTKARKTLAIAESCTGGLIGDTLTNVPGASKYFLLGVTAYDNAAKTQLLGVSSAIFKKYGAVSSQAARAMAQGVRQILKTDYGLSVTGIAGPGGATPGQPVGLVFIGLSRGAKTTVKKCLFKGSRRSIKHQACQTALKILCAK